MKINIDDIEPVAHDLMRHCQQKLGFKDPPGLFFAEDGENGDKLLGKTAYYDPSNKDVVVFTTNRHGKDVLRSIAHELVHHMQNLRGDFDTGCETTPGYAQANPKLRKMEAEAYLLGNMLFRDWEDGRKSKKLQEQKEKFTMKKSTIKKMIKEEIMRILNEDVKNPIEEECDECPDIREIQRPDPRVGNKGLSAQPREVIPADVETESPTGIDPTLEPGYEASQRMGRDWEFEAAIKDILARRQQGLGENFGDPRPDEEGLPHPFETPEEYEEYLRVGKEMEAEYAAAAAAAAADDPSGGQMPESKGYPDPKHGPTEEWKKLSQLRTELIQQGAPPAKIDKVEKMMRAINPRGVMRTRASIGGPLGGFDEGIEEGCGDDPEELEEDLNEGDFDSDVSQTLFTGIKSSQGEADAKRRKEEEEEAAKAAEGEAIRRAVGGGISQGQHAHSQATAAKKKTKYRGSSYANESATVRTPEIENALYESRFTSRDTKLFKKLVGKWTK